MKIHTDDLEADYAIFGRIVLLWGHVKSALAELILTLTSAPFNLSKHKGVPQPFSQKCELALRGLESIDAMKPFRRYGIPTIRSLQPFHKLRSVIVHGRFQGRSANGYEFAVYNAKSGQLRVRILSKEQPEALAQKIDELGDTLQRLATDAKELRAKWRAANK